MPFYSSTLSRILDGRGLSVKEASRLTGVSENRLLKAISGEHVPTVNQLFNMSRRLSVPAFAFFMEDFAVPPTDIIDYRYRKPEAFKYGRNTLRFSETIKLRNFLFELMKRLDLEAPQQLFSIDIDESAEQLADAVAKLLDMKRIRKESKDKKDFFRNFRKSVEDTGIFVIQDHKVTEDIDGFALFHDKFSSHLIFINSYRRNAGAKSFTLAHELCHIFGKRSAVTNNYQYDNAVEAFCNDFASALLIPRNELLELIAARHYQFENYSQSVATAGKIAKEYKCSVSAVLVKLSKMHIVPEEYSRRFIKGFGSAGFEDSEKPSSGGPKDGPAAGVVDMAFIGTRATTVITQALRSEATSFYEVYMHTGFSKKRIEGLLEVASKNAITVE